MINPSVVSDLQGEWVEIQNTGSVETNINGLTLITGSNKHVFSSDLILEPLEYAVLCKNKDPKVNGGITCDYEYGNISLVNSGGLIALGDGSAYLDSLSYSESMVSEGKTIERIESEGSRTWKTSETKLASGDFGTPGSENGLDPLLLSDINEESSSSSVTDPPTGSTILAGSILINELLPNPEGIDSTSNEYIELINTTSSAIDLAGWYLEDSSGSSFHFSEKRIISPLMFHVLYKNEFIFPLRNTDGSILLFDKERRLIDRASFLGSAKSGYSYSRTKEGLFYWTADLTPGTENMPPQSSTENNINKKTPANQKANKSTSAKTTDGAEIATVTDLDKIDAMDNLSQIIASGIVVTQPGTPYNNSFYLQVKKKGILVRTNFDCSFVPGEKLKVQGTIHKVKAGNYLLVSGPENIEEKEHGDLIFSSLDDSLTDTDWTKLLGTPVSFKAIYVKRVFNSLYFRSLGGQQVRVYEPSGKSGAEAVLLTKDDSFEIEGVVDKTASGFRVLLADLRPVDNNTLDQVSENIEAGTGRQLDTKEGGLSMGESTLTEKQRVSTKHSPLLKNFLATENQVMVYFQPKRISEKPTKTKREVFETFLRNISSFL